MIDLTLRKPGVGQFDYPVKQNALIDDLQVAASLPAPPFGNKPAAISGLIWGYYGGQLWLNGVLTTIADGTLLLTASVTNYVEYDAAGTLSKNSSGFSADKNPVAEIATSGSAINSILDRRSQRDPMTGVLNKSVAGGADVTLTAAESRCDILQLSGALTGNINVILPARTRPLIVANGTSGAFSLTVKATSGTGVALSQGKHAVVYWDGTNVVFAFDDGAALAQSITMQKLTNGLINGGHEIWQRGISIAVAASSNGYGADRFVLSTGANEACTISQQAGLTSGSQFCGQVQRNNGQTGTTVLVYEQPFALEEIIKYRGQQIAISFQAATGANWSPASGTLNVTIACGTGAAARRGNAAYTSETQPLAQAFNIAAGSGAAAFATGLSTAIPTTTTQMTLMFTWTPAGTAGANDWVQLDDIMWSTLIGAAFERRLQGAEIALCLRYYRKTFDPTSAPTQAVGTATGCLASAAVNAVIGACVNWQAPVAMRTTPTVITYNPTQANANWRNEGNTADDTAVVFPSSPNNVIIYASGAAGSTRWYIHATASAEL